MKFGVMFAEALQAMAANRLRTFLTMLGMIIGVSALILTLAIGQGVQATIYDSINALGSNVLMIATGSTNIGGVKGGIGSLTKLTMGDAQAISEISGVSTTAPFIVNSAQIIYASNNWNTNIVGVTPEYMQVADWKVSDGSYIAENDVQNISEVAVLGKTVAQKLFGDETPVGGLAVMLLLQLIQVLYLEYCLICRC